MSESVESSPVVKPTITMEEIERRLDLAVTLFDDGNDDIGQNIVRQLLTAIRKR